MTQTQDNSLFEKAYDPILQAAGILGLVVVVILFSRIVDATGIIEVGQKFPWLTAASFMLFFSVANSFVSLSSKNLNAYWTRSILSFVGLAGATALTAYLFSSIPISEAGSYRWIYIVVTFGYLVFLSMMGFMKRIVEFAQREEWNQPRIRTRKPGRSKKQSPREKRS